MELNKSMILGFLRKMLGKGVIDIILLVMFLILFYNSYINYYILMKAVLIYMMFIVYKFYIKFFKFLELLVDNVLLEDQNMTGPIENVGRAYTREQRKELGLGSNKNEKFNRLIDKLQIKSLKFFKNQIGFTNLVRIIIFLLPGNGMRTIIIPNFYINGFYFRIWINGNKDIFFKKYFGGDCRLFFDKLFKFYYIKIDIIIDYFIRQPIYRMLLYSGGLREKLEKMTILNFLKVRFFVLIYVSMLYFVGIFPFFYKLNILQILVIMYLIFLFVWPLYLNYIEKSVYKDQYKNSSLSSLVMRGGDSASLNFCSGLISRSMFLNSNFIMKGYRYDILTCLSDSIINLCSVQFELEVKIGNKNAIINLGRFEKSYGYSLLLMLNTTKYHYKEHYLKYLTLYFKREYFVNNYGEHMKLYDGFYKDILMKFKKAVWLTLDIRFLNGLKINESMRYEDLVLDFPNKYEHSGQYNILLNNYFENFFKKSDELIGLKGLKGYNDMFSEIELISDEYYIGGGYHLNSCCGNFPLNDIVENEGEDDDFYTEVMKQFDGLVTQNIKEYLDLRNLSEKNVLLYLTIPVELKAKKDNVKV